MQLTTHTDYSLRLLIYLGLSRDKAPATVQEIALSYGISANHIAKGAQTLTRLGYVKSLRGRGGGLVLAGDPERISVGEVDRQTENLKPARRLRRESMPARSTRPAPRKKGWAGRRRRFCRCWTATRWRN